MPIPADARLGPCEIVALPGAGVMAACLALATAMLIFACDPATTWWFPSCPLHALTGWLCPFCGSLRALHALLVGAPVAAFSLNPLTTTGAVAGLVACVHDVVRPTRATHCERLTTLCFSTRALAFVIAFGVLRNVSAPFRWMVQ